VSVWVLIIWVSGLQPLGGHNPEVWLFQNRTDCIAVAEGPHAPGVSPGQCYEVPIIAHEDWGKTVKP
jgi:hypothetical protein